MKHFKCLALFLGLSIGATAFANSDSPSFSGECTLIDVNGHETIFGSFQDHGDGSTNRTVMPFIFPDTDLKYHVTTLIHENPGQETQLQIWLIADLDGEYIARSIASHVAPGTILSLSSKIRDGSRKIEVICHGTFG